MRFLLQDLLPFMFMSPDPDPGGGGSDDKPDGGGEQDPEDDPFDKPRAMSTIAKLRAENKGLKDQTKLIPDLQKRLTDLESRDKTDLEKERDRAAAAEKARTDLEASSLSSLKSTRTKIAKMAIRNEAIRQGADDDLVVALIDLNTVEFSDPSEDDPIGEPQGVDKIVESWIKKKPALLLKSDQDKKKGPSPTEKPANGEVVSKDHMELIGRQYTTGF